MPSRYRPVEPQSRQCDHCGTEFTPRRSDGRFCGTACRVAAHRAESVVTTNFSAPTRPVTRKRRSRAVTLKSPTKPRSLYLSDFTGGEISTESIAKLLQIDADGPAGLPEALAAWRAQRAAEYCNMPEDRLPGGKWYGRFRESIADVGIIGSLGVWRGQLVDGEFRLRIAADLLASGDVSAVNHPFRPFDPHVVEFPGEWELDYLLESVRAVHISSKW